MELRVLRYFLMVAREENITKAAQILHLTQPTLSRQLMQLEEELGVTLFHRGKYRITLTEDGMLLRRRAQELISLADKTVQELTGAEDALSGEISIGCGESANMEVLAREMVQFRAGRPQVRFNIFSGSADDIKERIERGLLDLGLLMEPVEIGKYEFVRLPLREVWGVLVRRDSPLASKPAVTPPDLLSTPLLMAGREMVRHELAGWFGDWYDQMQIAATYNLLLNAAWMVRAGVGAALCFSWGAVYEDLCFVPLSPALETGAVLVWKKNQPLTKASAIFVQRLKDAL